MKEIDYYPNIYKVTDKELLDISLVRKDLPIITELLRRVFKELKRVNREA